MTDLPYHYDWEPRFETSLGLRVKWFGRWGGDPDWSIEPSRLASDLSRLFKAHTGMTPKAWLIEARLQRAARLLAYPDATVEEIAGRCGFNCPFHFSRTFKRRFGIPPASYRRVRQVRGFVEP